MNYYIPSSPRFEPDPDPRTMVAVAVVERPAPPGIYNDTTGEIDVAVFHNVVKNVLNKN
jgi:hypothetical protein